MVERGYKKVTTYLKRDGLKRKNFPILGGHLAAEEHGEARVENVQVTRGVKAKMKEFRIYRWNPDKPQVKPFLQSFHVDLNSCGSMINRALVEDKEGTRRRTGVQTVAQGQKEAGWPLRMPSCALVAAPPALPTGGPRKSFLARLLCSLLAHRWVSDR
ncbi:hypothetical protein H6P81_001899 [Aristolochia fimbriata]|uniref:Uncharacterized protein n=1 Tax=Aristolochia fimbriata TaxID=158543 RepID=A0AAV7FBF0_ARIFI|nr:hypothetical protein H6P81_001899 [Aristolochia fimbriata]